MKLKITAVFLAILYVLSLFKLIDARTKTTATQLELDEAYKQIASLSYDLEEAYYTDREYLGEFTLTFYDACVSCCGKTDGVTYSGAKAQEDITVAVDPKVIPIGTYIYIEGFGYRIAQDIGGAVKGNRIDVYVGSHEKALRLGKQSKQVWRMK